MSRYRWVCPECGSDQIEVQATLVWNFGKQDWDVDDVAMDQDWCRDCKQTVTAIERFETEEYED